MSFVHTNVWTFYDIAHEAYSLMGQLEPPSVTPKPNGEPGRVLVFDPTQRSFKAALTTIVFCGVYLEAMLHLELVRKFGEAGAEKHDRKVYKNKLILLGCNNEAVLEASEHYRIIRREVVHEKAYPDSAHVRTAQVEAKKSIQFIDNVNEEIGIVRG